MGARTKTGKFAVGFTAVGFIMILTAMASPYWLVTDGKLQSPKFTNLGKYQNFFKYGETFPRKNSPHPYFCFIYLYL